MIRRHVLTVQPVRRDEIRITGHWKTPRHPKVHVIVLASAQLFVEPTYRNQQVAAVHDRTVHPDEVTAEQLHVRRFARRLEALTDRPPVRIDVAVTAVHEPAVRRTSETGDPGFDRGRFQAIVRIEKDDKRGVERSKPHVASG
jgi:hypothetical protein